MLKTLLAIKAFCLIFRASFCSQSSLSIQPENQIKFLQSLGNHLFMGTQSKPFKVFNVVSTQEPNLPWFLFFFFLTRIMVDTQEQLKSHLCPSDMFFPCPSWPLLSWLMAKTDEVGVWCAVSPSEGLELAWNIAALIFAESSRKSWHSTKRSFGPFCNCLFKATVLYENKSNTKLQFHLFSVSPYTTMFFLQWVYNFMFYMPPFFSFLLFTTL